MRAHRQVQSVDVSVGFPVREQTEKETYPSASLNLCIGPGFATFLASLRVNPRDEKIECPADEEQYPGNDSGRYSGFMISGQIGFESGGQQPHLDNQQQGNQRQRTVNRGEAVFSSR